MNFFVVLAQENQIITFYAFLSQQEQASKGAELTRRGIRYKAFTFHLEVNAMTKPVLTKALGRIVIVGNSSFKAATPHIMSLLKGE